MADYPKSISSTVTFVPAPNESARFFKGIPQTFTFAPVADGEIAPVIAESPSSTVTFTNTAAEGYDHPHAVSQTATFVSTAAGGRRLNRSASTAITIGSTFVGSRVIEVEAETVVAFTQTLTRAGAFARSLSHTVNFNSGVFAPRIGYGLVYLIDINYQTSIGFKKPRLGNVQRLTTQTLVRHSRSGDRYSYRRTPHYETWSITLENLNEATFEALIQFMKDYAGTDVLFLDHKSYTWQGVILTDPLELIQEGRNQCGDLYTVTLEFEGEKLN